MHSVSLLQTYNKHDWLRGLLLTHVALWLPKTYQHGVECVAYLAEPVLAVVTHQLSSL